MNRRDKLIGAVCVIVIMTALLSGFTRSVLSSSVENLLIKRTQILQDAYFGMKSVERAELDLQQILTYPLLSEDVQSLRESLPGQMDWIRYMEILSLKETTSYIDCHAFLVQIRWHMSGLSGNYVEEYRYHVVLQESRGKMYIMEFSPIIEEN